MKTYKTKLTTISIIAEPIDFDAVKISSAQDAIPVLKNVWPVDIGVRESIYAIFLNRMNRTISVQLLSAGGTAGTVADSKLLFAAALGCMAHKIILAHNHPSGTLQPSQSDIELTRKIKEGGKLLDIELLDHLILSPTFGYYSFANEGLI